MCKASPHWSGSVAAPVSAMWGTGVFWLILSLKTLCVCVLSLAPLSRGTARRRVSYESHARRFVFNTAFLMENNPGIVPGTFSLRM